MTCIVFFIFLDLPWPKEAPWRLLEGSQCCKSHVVEAVQHYHSLDHLGGESESADEDDGDHRLVVLLLDGDDGPGVGEDGEKADWQGEDEEGGIKHLQVKNKSGFHSKNYFTVVIPIAIVKNQMIHSQSLDKCGKEKK